MGRRLALLIATYEYEDTGLRQLTTPAHDAEALAAVLADSDIAGFDVTTLVNEPHHRVGRAIGDFYRDRRRDDLTLLYFTGHGLKDDEGRLYLAMTNTLRDNLLFTGLPAEQIDQAMERCVSRQKVLVLDCCYSGAYPAGRIAKADTTVHTLQRFQGRGRTVLTASDATQYSFEGDRPHGRAPQSVFTRYLVEGLRDGSADLDRDGDVTVDELYSYVHDRVVEEMPQQRPKKQDDVEGRTVIARNVNWTLPTHLRNAVTSPISGDRLAALDGLARLHRIGNDVVRAHVAEEIRRLADDDSKLVSSAAATLRSTILTGGEPVVVRQPEPSESPQPPGSPEPPEPRRSPEPPTVEPDRVGTATPAAVEPPEPQTVKPAAVAPSVPPPSESQPSVPLPSESRPATPAVARPRRDAGGGFAWLRRLPVPATRRAKALVACGIAFVIAAAAVTTWLWGGRGTEYSGESKSVQRVVPAISAAAGFVRLSADGTVVATIGSPDGETTGEPATTSAVARRSPVDLWDTADGRRLATFPTGTDVTFGPDDKTAAVVVGDTVVLWNRASTTTGATLTGHKAAAIAVFSPDGKTIATSGTCACTDEFDNPVRVWDASTGQSVATLTGHNNGVQSMAFSPDGKLLVTGAVDRTVRVWDLTTKTDTAVLTAGYLVAMSPDGRTLATSGQYTDDRHIRLWDVTTGQNTATLADVGDPIAFGTDGKTLATRSPDGQVSQLWDVATREITYSDTHAGPWTTSPDNGTVAVGATGTVVLVDVKSGDPRGALTGHTDRITNLAYSADGRTLATAGSSNTVRLWPVG